MDTPRETSSDVLRCSRDGDVLSIRLNRPHRLNALDRDLVEALIAALDHARESAARLVVFSGEGKGFSGGFDFGGLAEQSDGDLALRFLRLEQLLQAVHYAPFMTLALAHGACFGAAADLFSSCAHRIAAPGARFRMPGLMFGVALGTRRLSEVVGRDAALELLTASKVFGPEEALRLGFATAVCAPEEWDGRIAELQEAVAALPEASFEKLLRLTRPDQGETDMAELARSVAAPGLKRRIEAYVADMKK